MIKITKVEIENFKSLYKSSIDSLGDVNLFYGFNNSGKSNIFKFLDILFQRKQIKSVVDYKDESNNGREQKVSEARLSMSPFYEGAIYDQPYLFSKNNREIPIKFKVELIISNDFLPVLEQLNKEKFLGVGTTSVVIAGEITSRGISESHLSVTSAMLNGKIFYEFRDSLGYFFEKNKSDLTRREGESILSTFNDLVTYIDTDRNFTTEFIKDGVNEFDSKNFKNWLFELNINSDKYEIFNQLVAFISNFNFSDAAKARLTGNMQSFPFSSDAEISFSRFGKEVEVMLKNDAGRFPLKNYGTGIQQFFYILAKIFGSKSRIVIIEEIEINLSQIYQLEMLRFLKTLMGSNFDQLMFSSHSPFFTQFGADMLDYVHFVMINSAGNDGTIIESHDDPTNLVDDQGNSLFSLLFS